MMIRISGMRPEFPRYELLRDPTTPLASTTTWIISAAGMRVQLPVARRPY